MSGAPTRLPVTGVVTSFDSAATLGDCLASLAFCDEIVVLDSGSVDATRAIAERHGARFIVERFRGYGAQKQSAIGHANHDWILLLDSDEAVDADATAAVQRVLAAPGHAGYRICRREWLFWRWQSAHARHNRYVRLFDRARARMSPHAVHESVLVAGGVGELRGLILHRGDRDIAAKVDKANRYSTLQANERTQRAVPVSFLRVLGSSVVAFWRYYLLRGHYRAGWAGFVAARIHAFYAFLKYAKRLEAARRSDHP